jgi:hypothetical protein
MGLMIISLMLMSAVSLLVLYLVIFVGGAVAIGAFTAVVVAFRNSWTKKKEQNKS